MGKDLLVGVKQLLMNVLVLAWEGVCFLLCESIKKRTEKRKEKREKRKEKREKRKMRYEQIQTMAQHFLSGKKNP